MRNQTAAAFADRAHRRIPEAMRLNHAVRSPDSRKRFVNSSWKNFMKRIVLIAGLTMLSLGVLRADDDALLRLLVRKGIITEREAE
jgi:hypothetical protein